MVVRAIWNLASGLIHRAFNPNLPDGILFKSPAVWKSRTRLIDCDLNLHMNNSSYLYNMELARWYLIASSGGFRHAFSKRRSFLVASQAIRYRYPLLPYQIYEIHTTVPYVQDDWLYFIHSFICPKTKKVYVEALCRTTIRDRGKSVSCKTLFTELGILEEQLPTKEIPNSVQEFLKWDYETKLHMENSIQSKTEASTSKSPPDI